MITVTKTITATDTDVLSGSELASTPENGQIDIFAAASQNDWKMTIGGPGGETVIRDQKIQQRTNGMPSLIDDVPFSIPVGMGGKYTLSVTVATAGTGNIIAKFRGLDEF